jgi:hypothetical protein
MRPSEGSTAGRSAIGAGPSALRCEDSGAGDAIVFLRDSTEQSALIEQLAQNFRVLAFTLPRAVEASTIAAEIDQAAARHGVAQYSVIAGSDYALAAIALAISFAGRVNALVLITPGTELLAGAANRNGLTADLAFEQITAPTLTLFGTRQDAAAFDVGRSLAKRIANCFYILVYDSDCNIGRHCPQALLELVRDFLKRRDRFVVGRDSSAIRE